MSSLEMQQTEENNSSPNKREVSEVVDVAEKNKVQETLAIIKPDAIQVKDAIIERIKKEGFKITREQEILSSKEKMCLFYREHESKPFYDDLVQWMSSSPIYAMTLEKENAVQDWRVLMGPTDSAKAKVVEQNSIRALFGTDGLHNAVHGSDCLISAEREIGLLFNNTTDKQQSDNEQDTMDQNNESIQSASLLVKDDISYEESKENTATKDDARDEISKEAIVVESNVDNKETKEKAATEEKNIQDREKSKDSNAKNNISDEEFNKNAAADNHTHKEEDIEKDATANDDACNKEHFESVGAKDDVDNSVLENTESCTEMQGNKEGDAEEPIDAFKKKQESFFTYANDNVETSVTESVENSITDLAVKGDSTPEKPNSVSDVIDTIPVQDEAAPIKIENSEKTNREPIPSEHDQDLAILEQHSQSTVVETNGEIDAAVKTATTTTIVTEVVSDEQIQNTTKDQPTDAKNDLNEDDIEILTVNESSDNNFAKKAAECTMTETVSSLQIVQNSDIVQSNTLMDAVAADVTKDSNEIKPFENNTYGEIEITKTVKQELAKEDQQDNINIYAQNKDIDEVVTKENEESKQTIVEDVIEVTIPEKDISPIEDGAVTSSEIVSAEKIVIQEVNSIETADVDAIEINNEGTAIADGVDDNQSDTAVTIDDEPGKPDEVEEEEEESHIAKDEDHLIETVVHGNDLSDMMEEASSDTHENIKSEVESDECNLAKKEQENPENQENLTDNDHFEQSTSSANSEGTDSRTISRDTSSTANSSTDNHKETKKSSAATKIKKPSSVKKDTSKTVNKKPPTTKKAESTISRLSSGKKPALSSETKKTPVKLAANSEEKKTKVKSIASGEEKKTATKPARVPRVALLATKKSTTTEADNVTEEKAKKAKTTKSAVSRLTASTAASARRKSPIGTVNEKKPGESATEQKKKTVSPSSTARTTTVKKSSVTTQHSMQESKGVHKTTITEKRSTHKTSPPNSTTTKKVISSKVSNDIHKDTAHGAGRASAASTKKEVNKKPIKKVTKSPSDGKKESASSERKRVVKKEVSNDPKKDIKESKQKKPNIEKGKKELEEHGKKEESKEDEAKEDEAKEDEAKEDEAKEDEAKEDEAKEDEEKVEKQEINKEIEENKSTEEFKEQEVVVEKKENVESGEEEKNEAEEQVSAQEEKNTANNETVIIVEDIQEKSIQEPIVQDNSADKEKELLAEHPREHSRSTEIASIRSKFESLQATTTVVTSQSKDLRSKSPTNRVSDMINRFTH
ncbi:hypothetical protein G6F16_009479 [Rhizopus arrhizus]|nr:hypothetical protein G6F21_008833 [Rhizopus arrhizus]KAG0808777.1 hypothetical protein G6F20_009298 [Rhizopus arrhizus]KAG0826158.1 hypothetical protein G6F19_009428 [Rhizopus arrhizus]KAG0828009.1 hypothetical protein G6F18_009264 [Rhizopus arrhizus]KAG0851026.1 hypothetical protein G6F17_009363 [Rhizopus arrhizus]